jgi:membrane-associated phospholipid phosphatase
MVVLLLLSWCAGGCSEQRGADRSLRTHTVTGQSDHDPASDFARMGHGAFSKSCDRNPPSDLAAKRNLAADWFLASYRTRDAYSLGIAAKHDTFVEDPASVRNGDGDRRASGREPLPGLWDTIERDLRAAPRDLWEDSKAVYGNAPNLIILGATYGGSLALQQTGVDNTIEDTIDDGRIYSNDFADAFGALGNPGLHFGVAGLWYLAGQQRQDERTYEVGRTLFSALAVNGITTMLGQAASADRSPNGERGAFPSGHTSSTFTLVSVMHEAYGPWVGAPLYALGVAVAAERVDDGEHYFSDVVMGAVMGLVIGHTVAGEHKLELFGGEIVPYADPTTGANGIAWHVSF